VAVSPLLIASVFNSTVGVTGTEAKTEQLGRNLLKFLNLPRFWA
jgi:hypothetical protein